jgi:hypothetical protein
MSVHITAASSSFLHGPIPFLSKSTSRRSLYHLVSILVFLSLSVSVSVSVFVGRSESQYLAHLEEDLSGIVDALELVGTGPLCVDGNIYSECSKQKQPA